MLMILSEEQMKQNLKMPHLILYIHQTKPKFVLQPSLSHPAKKIAHQKYPRAQWSTSSTKHSSFFNTFQIDDN